MKIYRGRVFVVFTLLIIFSLTAAAQIKKDTRTVVDYYNMLLGDSLKKEGIEPKIAVQDTKNGYIKIDISPQVWLEVVLFRKKDKSALVVSGLTECDPLCNTEIEAYEFDGNKERVVTGKFIPVISADETAQTYSHLKKAQDENLTGKGLPVIWEIPRFGRTIKLKVDKSFAPSDITLYELRWKDDKFIVAK